MKTTSFSWMHFFSVNQTSPSEHLLEGVFIYIYLIIAAVVPAVNYKELSSDDEGESSVKIRECVQIAREIQTKRFCRENYVFSNSHMQSREIRRYCPIDQEGQLKLKTAISKLGLSAISNS